MKLLFYLQRFFREAYGFAVFAFNFFLYAMFVILLSTIILESAHSIHIRDSNDQVLPRNFSNTTVSTDIVKFVYSFIV